MNASRDEAQPLTRIKLNLVSESETDHIRNELRSTLTALRKRGIIDKDTDIYRHYLMHLLNHTKEQLISSNELQQDMLIEFVLCVPAKWPVTACRIMQTALEEAVKDVGLSKNAEAAAECILAEAGRELYVSFPDHQRPH
jgi:Flp pilus assembly CpaE family ATPase